MTTNNATIDLRNHTDPAGNVGIGGNPTFPTSSNRGESSPAIPMDSLIQDYLELGREFTESEDAIIIGSILPVISAKLGRRVWIDFGGPKYSNLFSMVVTGPGLRKSTTISLAEKVAREILQDDSLIPSVGSEQALFELYLENPDRLLVESEGNTILSEWASTSCGKSVAKRFLKLYDCEGWSQNYMRQAKDNGGDPVKVIDKTSTSLIVGTTFNSCRLNRLEVRDGMRRRFAYYVSEQLARTVYWPKDVCASTEFESLVARLQTLDAIQGKLHLTERAMDTWRRIQDDNRARIRLASGVDEESEAHASALSEEGSRTLKLAMIFQVCRWAKDPSSADWKLIDADVLKIAAEHARYCIHAAQSLDRIAERAEIRDEADAILASIRALAGIESPEGPHVEMTKTDLTNKFAKNPGRSGSLSPSRLHGQLIPDLIHRGCCQLVSKHGKREVYAFTLS